ncbi:sulfurtransferase [Mangrovimonas aestuarii]|uniref:sulfurtransferase n=1 Tax=Mangrovimonas aestuarii TaxID=3018443 RepID=UPI002378CB20|nr:sulfurtransferase [Mangrovimonas aestuarii]
MKSIKLPSDLVSVDWLKANLDADNLIILDASIPKVTASAQETNSKEYIPNSRFFDIKEAFSDSSSTFPNTLPSVGQFENEARKLGINNDSAIVVYDDKGIYSSARPWWMFKAMGYDNVAVLDGGLPAWKKKGYPIQNVLDKPDSPGNFKGNYNPDFFKFFDDIQKSINDSSVQIIDARSKDRFEGVIEEPRKGLRSGHIPGSSNLPFGDLLNEGVFKSPEDVNMILTSVFQPNKNYVFSCGSGITACVLALGAKLQGYENLSVYDGSWTEYGSLT